MKLSNLPASNQELYESQRIVNDYVHLAPAGLTVPEQYCLEQVPRDCRKRVLDIGIGAGRTTPILSKLFQQYIGIDYSVNMIAATKRVLPNVDVRVMDARKLLFDERSFDCVMFSFNGIDSVSLEDRQIILREIARVLKPGGYLIYSTHNLAYIRTSAWLNSFWVSEILGSWRATTILADVRRSVRFIWNRFRYFRSQRQYPDAALINDPSFAFKSNIIYVDISKELTRLESLGFDVLATVGNTKKTAIYDQTDCWVYLLTRMKTQ